MSTCRTCPFRPDARAAAMPGGFDVGWARERAPEASGEAMLGSALFVCHHRPDGGMDALCGGWLNDQVRRGVPSLPLRLAVMMGRAQLPAEPDPSLLTYEAMLERMAADPDAEPGP